jgi:hypothetical protein
VFKQLVKQFCVLLSKLFLATVFNQGSNLPFFRFVFLLAFGVFCCLYRDLMGHNDYCVVIYSAFRQIKHSLGIGFIFVCLLMDGCCEVKREASIL